MTFTPAIGATRALPEPSPALDAAARAALVLGVEVNAETGLDGVTTAALLCDVDAADLWDHMAAAISLWPALAALPTAPPDWLHRWLGSLNPTVLAAAASNRSAHPEDLELMVRRRMSRWPLESANARPSDPLGSAAVNPNLPESVMRTLAAHESDRLRARVAANRALPADLLEALAADPAPDVRCAVARNTASSPEILELAVASSSPDDVAVRCRVAAHPCVPAAFLDEMVARVRAYSAATGLGALHPFNSQVRVAAAKNPAVGAEVLAVLAGDPASNVRTLARWTLDSLV